MKKSKSISLIFTLLFIFSGFNAFSQENESGDEIQELLEKEAEKDEIYNYINSELQKNFTIVVSRHNFDLNPHTSAYSVEAQILTGLYEGLFSYDPITLNPEYALATSYRISRDKKRWTVTLRDGIKESDGSPITSEKIRDSWIRLLETKDAPFSSLFDIVRGAKDYREGRGESRPPGKNSLHAKFCSCTPGYSRFFRPLCNQGL